MEELGGEPPVLDEVVYDPSNGRLRVRVADCGVTISGLGEDVFFWRLDNPPAQPLWLTHTDADILKRMVDYVLKNVKISAQAQHTLEALAPRLEALRDALARERPGRAEES